MARASKRLIHAIKRTSDKLKNGNAYEWGHMGACNCGNLAQELTEFSRREIHAYAMRGHGDWTEQVAAFCPTSEMPMDLLISQMIAAGLSLEDLINLERLKDPEVLSGMPAERRMRLRHNVKEDVILYLNTWAEVLTAKLEKSPELVINS